MAGLSNVLREQEASLLGASIYERMIQLGESPEDAHRAAQQAVTGAFGKSSGVSATAATGSADPILGGNGPKLPPPSQMAANLAADLAGRNQGSQPPPTPQAPPSWWGLSPGTWTAQPPPTPVTWNVVTTSPWDDDWRNTGPYWDRNWWKRIWDKWNWSIRMMKIKKE
jgi:hypothetical protein